MSRHMTKEPEAGTSAEEEYRRAKDVALKFLGYQSRSVRQVRAYLSRKGYQDEIIVRVLEKLQNLGLVDDRRLCAERVVRGIESERSGPLRLRQELYRAGIDRTVVEDCLAEVLAGRTEEDLALATARTHLPRVAGLPAPEVWRKLFGFLARRGYSADAISAALRTLLGEPDL